MQSQLDTASYQGMATFAQRPLLTEPEQLDEWRPDVAVVGAPWDDSTTNRPGARFAPRALRALAYGPGTYHMDYGIEIFDELEVVDFGDAICTHGMWEPSAKAIRDRVGEVARRGIIPLVIGGDHSITWPSASAVADAAGWGEIGIIHFDAHADTAEEIGGNYASHGTPMRRLIESGAVMGRHFVQVGLRGYWPPAETFEWMAEQEMRWHTMNEVYERGLTAVIDDAIEEATASPKGIYLSVDIDVLDPGFAPGTGTPEPGGIAPVDLLRAIRRITRHVKVLAVDIVEVAPAYDWAELTINNAHRVGLEAIAGLAMRKLDAARS
ncbi:MAG: agmatinase [Actinomycetota bacterium]|nr:agmatinase [Actinomycetota bacterium]